MSINEHCTSDSSSMLKQKLKKCFYLVYDLHTYQFTPFVLRLIVQMRLDN